MNKMIVSVESRHVQTTADGINFEAVSIESQLRQSFSSGFEAGAGLPRRPEHSRTDTEAGGEGSPRHDLPPCASEAE